MPQGPLGGPRPGAECTLVLSTWYEVPNEVGLELENRQIRENTEESILNHLDSIRARPLVEDVDLSPAGRLIGIDMLFADSDVASEQEDQLLDLLDEAVDEFVTSRSSRPAEGKSEYEWSVR